ncbi:hypothetical protein QL285_037156 [Trifolium repens]|nr:hypothetical protein QL285_037156 [Trifolium repens]
MAANLTKESSLVNGNVQSCSIYLVPRGLKECNLDVYMPRVVSIGPRFIGRADLVPMEEAKSRCMLSLIDRVTLSPPSSRAEILDACRVAIRTLALDVHRSYDPDMIELKTLSDHELRNYISGWMFSVRASHIKGIRF